MMSFLALALAAATEPSLAQPLTSQAEWISVADYPPDALKAHQEGIVGYQLDVDAAGDVIGCRVSQSSGARALDAGTCAVLFMRARFRPMSALAQGQTASFTSRVHWVYPQVKPAPDEAPVELRSGMGSSEGKSILWIDQSGMITSCEPAPPAYKNVLPMPDVCFLFPAGGRWSGPVTLHGKLAKRKVVVQLSMDQEVVK